MTVQPALASALLAEDAFYRAFEAADPIAMMRVWDSAESITCVHPFGPILVGVTAVGDSWRSIFRQQVACRVEIDRVSIVNTDDLAVHVVRENILVPIQQRRFAPVLATNIYRRFGMEWRMVLHHASPSPPQVETASQPDVPRPTRH